MNQALKILYTGRYYTAAPRGLTLRQGLRANGATVYEEHIDHQTSRPWNYKLSRKLKSFKEDVDAVVLAGLGNDVVKSAYKFSKIRRIPLIVDFFFSMHESLVHDRKVVKENSFKANRYFKTDLIALQLADAVFFDTLENLEFAEDTFKVKIKNKAVIPVGCPLHFFEPPRIKPLEGSRNFNVVFCGTFIPLQGIEYILRAAKKLKDIDPEIQFTLIYKEGLTYSKMRSLAVEYNLTNLNFVPRIPHQELNHYIAGADIALGIFGDTPKADRVVAHKIYDSLAVGVPTITKDSPATRNLLTTDSCLLIEPNELSNAILELKKNGEKRDFLGRNAANLAKNEFHPKILGAKLIQLIQTVL